MAHSPTALLHPSFGEEREYRVTVRGSVDRATLRRVSEGIELEDGLTAPARVGTARFDRETRTSTALHSRSSKAEKDRFAG